MFFVGTFEISLDNKNRLSVPFSVREATDREQDGEHYYVLPGFRRGTLALYPDRYFRRKRGHVVDPEAVSQETYEWRQFELSQAALVMPDSQGRIVIPDRLLKRAGLEREVTLIGVQDHLEMWNRGELETFLDQKWPDYPERRLRAMQEIRDLTPERGPEQPPAGQRLQG
jgi:MraZ protein